MEFEEASEALGFRPRQGRNVGTGGAQVLEAQPNPFMRYVLQVYADDTALFTWEFALGEYLALRGIQMGSDETLNQFIYPRQDLRGPQDGPWLISAVEQTQAMLAEIHLAQPEPAEEA
jgi:hypothetical protein